MIKSGFQRIIPHQDPEAVAWWFVREFEDGFIYARGGRCRTTREARHLYRQHWDLSGREHVEFEERPLFFLREDGSLAEIDYGPYGVAQRIGRIHD